MADKAYIAYITVRGQCCDHGWGTPGNAKLFHLTAPDMASAKVKAGALASEEVGEEHPLKSVDVYEIAGLAHLDVAAILREREKAKEKKQVDAQEAAERAEFARLKAKFEASK